MRLENKDASGLVCKTLTETLGINEITPLVASFILDDLLMKGRKLSALEINCKSNSKSFDSNLFAQHVQMMEASDKDDTESALIALLKQSLSNLPRSTKIDDASKVCLDSYVFMKDYLDWDQFGSTGIEQISSLKALITLVKSSFEDSICSEIFDTNPKVFLFLSGSRQSNRLFCGKKFEILAKGRFLVASKLGKDEDYNKRLAYYGFNDLVTLFMELNQFFSLKLTAIEYNQIGIHQNLVDSWITCQRNSSVRPLFRFVKTAIAANILSLSLNLNLNDMAPLERVKTLYTIVQMSCTCIQIGLDQLGRKKFDEKFREKMLSRIIADDHVEFVKSFLDFAENESAQVFSQIPLPLSLSLLSLISNTKIIVATMVDIKSSHDIETLCFADVCDLILLELDSFGTELGTSWTSAAYETKIVEAIEIVAQILNTSGDSAEATLNPGQLNTEYFSKLKKGKGFLFKSYPTTMTQFVKHNISRKRSTRIKPKQCSKQVKSKTSNSPTPSIEIAEEVGLPQDSSAQVQTVSTQTTNPWVDRVRVGKLLAVQSEPSKIINVEREPPNFLDQLVPKIDRAPEVDLRDIAFSYVLIGERIYRKHLLPVLNQLGVRQVFRRSIQEFEAWLVELNKSDPAQYQELGLGDENFKLCLKWYKKRLSVCHPQISQNAAKRKALLRKLNSSLIEADCDISKRLAGCFELAPPAKKFSFIMAQETRPEHLLSPCLTEAYISILYLQEAFDCEQLVVVRNAIAHTFLSKDRFLAYINYLYPSHNDYAFLQSLAER